MLRSGCAISLPMLIVVWKALYEKIMPAAVVAEKIAAVPLGINPAAWPKFCGSNPVPISTRIVNVGIANLKIEIKLVNRVSNLTDQKFSRVNARINKKTMTNPSLVMSPCRKKPRVQLAHAHGQELMYCTAATASMGMMVSSDSQLDHPATNPNSGPCENAAYWLIPPLVGNIVPSSI